MRVLGCSGGLDAGYSNQYNFPYDYAHDAAAVLIEDGKVIAGIEEERLNRIKHTNKSCAKAVRFCLESSGLSPGDVDAFAFYATEPYCEGLLSSLYLRHPEISEMVDTRTILARALSVELAYRVDPGKLFFVHHHLAHAASAYLHSGFNESLVFTLDGQGDGVSSMVFSGRGGELDLLRTSSVEDSMGFLYREVIRFLGYDIFDEYKVMGLAPYGNPARFRKLLGGLYQLLPEGNYSISLPRVISLRQALSPRRKGEEFTQIHMDVAAALQEALETIAFHVLRHFRKSTGHAKLCMSGGVAHNCSLNGKILYSGMFEDIFVHPAAHDAGCALGAALHVHKELSPSSCFEPLTQVYWGTDAGEDELIRETLMPWQGLIHYEKMSDTFGKTASLLAEGAVIGWVQGRSEFGPRALGNRSIIADPRSAANKDRINKMVKKREGYRPFAPSVVKECVGDFFDVPDSGKDFSYMTFVVKVREDKRALMGAITHVDGTARIQSVSRESNERYWKLIDAFGRITGVPVLLNTSFNNNAEPIVDSLQDALVCYLTTGLNFMVAGDYLVSRKNISSGVYLDMVATLPVSAGIRRVEKYVSGNELGTFHELFFDYDHGRVARISKDVYDILTETHDGRTLGELCRAHSVTDGRETALVQEILELWSWRMVRLSFP